MENRAIQDIHAITNFFINSSGMGYGIPEEQRERIGELFSLDPNAVCINLDGGGTTIAFPPRLIEDYGR